MRTELSEKSEQSGETAKPAVASPERGAAIQRRVTEQHVCILTFDRPNSSANIFDRATLEELAGHVDYLEQARDLAGVVLASAKPSIFIAGADIHALMQVSDPEELRRLIELGQMTFERLRRVSLPKVAAIHGACLGGGYEVTLACDYRIASTDRATKVGLPETMLGILPAWGGATYLPRLIGLPAALDVILGGKVLPAKVALRRGLVDELCPVEYLLEIAQRKVTTEGKRIKQRRVPKTLPLWNNPLVSRLVGWRAGQQIQLKTRGHYPAVLKALEVMVRGLRGSAQQSMALEAAAILELAGTPICRNLMTIFLLQERAKKRGVSAHGEQIKARVVERTSVIGAGIMGAGIAQWLSARGLPVILQDVNVEAVAQGMNRIRTLYQEGVKRHHFVGSSRVDLQACKLEYSIVSPK